MATTTTTDCEHPATVTGAAMISEQRLCHREAEEHWHAAPGAPTVCLACHQAVTLPEESR